MEVLLLSIALPLLSGAVPLPGQVHTIIYHTDEQQTQQAAPPQPVRNISVSTRKSGLVFDIGLHTGGDSEYYLSKGMRVVAIEADPTMVATARQNGNLSSAESFWRNFGRPSLTIMNVGIGSKVGKSTFYRHKEHPEWSSFVACHGKKPDCDEVLVDTTTCSKIMLKHGVPWFAKIDIEGYDKLCLQDIAANQALLQALPEFVQTEDRKSIDTLLSLGYSEFKLIDQMHTRSKGRHYAQFSGGLPEDLEHKKGQSGFQTAEEIKMDSAWSDEHSEHDLLAHIPASAHASKDATSMQAFMTMMLHGQ